MSADVKIGMGLGKVLYAMDFSPSSLAAFPFAASIARHFCGQVLLEHVTDVSASVPVDSSVLASLDKLLVDAEEDLIISQASETPHKLLADHGKVCPTLVSVADKCDVDLIVIGTHGLRGLRKLIQGSKAEQIMLLSSKPVLIVGPCVTSRPEFRRILFATDCSLTAMHALSCADSLRQVYKSSFILLHVNDSTTEEAPAETTPRTLKVLEDAREQGYTELAQNCETIVEFGPRAERIVEIARVRQADLIVLGTHSRSRVKSRIRAHFPGTMAYDVISQAHCPVLTVPFGVGAVKPSLLAS